MAGHRQPVSLPAPHRACISESVPDVVTRLFLVLSTLRSPSGGEESQAACVSVGGCPGDKELCWESAAPAFSPFRGVAGSLSPRATLSLPNAFVVRDSLRGEGLIRLWCRGGSQAACVTPCSTLGFCYWSILHVLSI